MKLHQDTQFIPTQEDIVLFLSEYGLALTGYTLANSGIENCTIILQTTTDKYVMRVYRKHKKKDKDIQVELDFVAYLGENDVPVGLPVANLKGDFLSHLEQSGYVWQAILMRHMRGSHPSHYSDELQANLATLQARMHNLAALYQPDQTSSKKLTELRETQFIRMIQDREAIGSDLQAFINRAENYVVRLEDSLPRGLCHLDFDNGNILSEGDVVTAVLDFDDLTNAPYVMCLAYTVWDIAYDLGFDAIRTYIEAYKKVRPLTEREERFIKPIMLFRHYVIGCMDIVENQMDEATLTRYLELERELLV